MCHNEFNRTPGLQETFFKNRLQSINIRYSTCYMSLFQIHNAHKDINGAEELSIVQIYWITESSLPFLNETFINFRICLE